ncbi:MAG TPA: amino acid permease [Phycisphaerales bacterium]|nr:amino acid permease [Phycisphaerales bacterium]
MQEDHSPTSANSTRPDLPRLVGFFGASGVMIGVMIGSGIFRTPPEIANHLASPTIILLTWLVGGALALAGALTFTELATMHPQSGGVYVFLREGYGRSTAFVFGWTYMLVTKPSAAAGIAVVSAECINLLLGTKWDIRIITSVILVVLTGFNILGVKGSTRLGVVLTAFKMAALLAIVVLGALYALGVLPGEGKGAATWPIAGTPPHSIWLAIAPVMAAVMWTYDGWSDVGAIAGEVKDPSRTLPRIFVLNTLAVTALYVGVNAVYLLLVPLEQMRGMDNVAPHVLGLLLGGAGATAVTLIIILSTIGSSHASIMTGARVSFAQARDGLLFGFLGHVHPRFQTPAVALTVQLCLSLTAIWVLGSFTKLAESFVFTMWIFYGLAGLAIFILRVRRPGAQRPFRCLGYPVVPALFVLSAAAMTGLAIADDPKTTGKWLGVLAIGYPVYWVWQWWNGRADRLGTSHNPNK